MPDLSSDELVVGANGAVLLAEVGATLPTDIGSGTTLQDVIDDLEALDFVHLGFNDEDGATFTDAKTIENKKAWQQFYPVRKIVTDRDAMAKFALLQWNRDTISFAFGGGTFTATANGTKYAPPAPEDIDERIMVVAWADGDKLYMVVLPKVVCEENVETQLQRTELAKFPITVGVLGVDNEDPWYFLTNDPAWEPSS